MAKASVLVGIAIGFVIGASVGAFLPWLPTLSEFQTRQIKPQVTSASSDFDEAELDAREKDILPRLEEKLDLLLSERSGDVTKQMSKGEVSFRTNEQLRKNGNNDEDSLVSFDRSMKRQRQSPKGSEEEKRKHQVGAPIGDGRSPFGLDFYIMGFPKCATSSLSSLFDTVMNETTIMRDKNGMAEYDIRTPKIAKELVETIEANRKENHKIKYYGIKMPTAISFRFNHFVRMREVQPDNKDNIKLIIGLRHPVLWFESFYNYKFGAKEIVNDAPSPSSLIGGHEVAKLELYSQMGQFERGLIQLGKFNISEVETKWLKEDNFVVVPTRNPVFLYISDQFADKNATRFDSFLHDLTSFMNIDGQISHTQMIQTNKARSKILNICDDEHFEVRKILLSNAIGTVNWMEANLKKGRDLYFGNKDHFFELLETWKSDPCGERTSGTVLDKAKESDQANDSQN